MPSSSPSVSPLADINKRIQASSEEGIRIDKIAISNDVPATDIPLDLHDHGVSQDVQHIDIKHRIRRYMIGSVIIFVIGLFFGLYARAIGSVNSSQASSAYLRQVSTVINYVYRGLDVVGLGKTYMTLKNMPLLLKDENTSYFGAIIDAPLSFASRKILIAQALDIIVQKYSTLQDSVTDLKTTIAQYGFLTEELQKLFDTLDIADVSLQGTLLSLEAVKFSAALHVYSYLDTFVVWFADYAGVDTATVQTLLTTLRDDADTIVGLYLSHCYLNPWEWDYTCGILQDFDYYYTTIRPQATIDITLFKKLMQYIDLKLEQTDVPSLAINFQKFDAQKWLITFSIDVNTLQQDEQAMIQRGIPNPHLFIVTDLVTLLRQSSFVIGTSIDARKIQVNPRIITIGNNQFSVNSSSLQFTLPVQKKVQQEIYDQVRRP